MFAKKSLPIIPLCLPFGKQSLAWLAAATTATTTTFAFFATAVVIQYVQLVHGFYLLSNRSLSI
jgi:hypothetical protein